MITKRALIRTSLKIASALHRGVYRLTGGSMGGTAYGAPVLLLTTTGRKTGRPRTTPLLYLTDGDTLVVVASYGGDEKDPAWWTNLQHTPRAQVQLKRVTKTVIAEQASAKDKRRLWPSLVQMSPHYEAYQQRTTRDIPVVLLRPETDDGRADPHPSQGAPIAQGPPRRLPG